MWSLGLLFAVSTAVAADTATLTVGTSSPASPTMGQVVSVPIVLDATGDVQGLQIAVEWDSAVKGVDLVLGSAVSGADVKVPRIADTFAVLGVVMDSDGSGHQIIPKPTGVTAMTVKVQTSVQDTPYSVKFTLVDKKYGTVDLGPLLANTVVVGGQSLNRIRGGLTVVDGTGFNVTIPPRSLTVQTATGTYSLPTGPAVDSAVKVLLSSEVDVQGFQVIVSTPPGLTLTNITLGADALGAQNEPYVDIDTGRIGVMMASGQTQNPPVIKAGTNKEIAVYHYTAAHECATPRVTDPAYPLAFNNAGVGTPPLYNVIVINGASIGVQKNLQLVDGSLTLTTQLCPVVNTKGFGVGSCTVAPVADENGVNLTVITAHAGEEIGVGLYYKSPEDDVSDEAEQTDQIQGVSMALCYDVPALKLSDTPYSIAGTVTEAVKAEFVHVEPGTVEGQLVVGILVDALPPFDGQTLPPTDDYLKLICVYFKAMKCGQTANIKFCEIDSQTPNGTVKIRNLVSVRNHSYVPAELLDGTVKIVAEKMFVRGDCNGTVLDDIATGSTDGEYAVDISDAASVISYLFLTGPDYFLPPCLDACDANDDAHVDLADAVYLLNYLFKFGKQPKPPFPAPGADPTADRISCLGGADICQ